MTKIKIFLNYNSSSSGRRSSFESEKILLPHRPRKRKKFVYRLRLLSLPMILALFLVLSGGGS
jgi:hypothetical protein